MNRSIIALVLVSLTTACRNPAVDPADTGVIGMSDTGDSDRVINVTAPTITPVVTDTGDVVVEDSGDDTASDTASAEPACEFELIASGGGRIEVSNELQFSLAEYSSDAVYDGLQEVFRFNVTSLHPECGTVAADTASFNIDATGGGETHWADGVRIEMVDLTVDPSVAIMSGATEMNSGGNIYGPHSGVLAIPAGETHTFAVFMDTSGASSDDMLKLTLRRYMHILDTPESAAAVMMSDDLEGDTLEF